MREKNEGMKIAAVGAVLLIALVIFGFNFVLGALGMDIHFAR